MKSLFTVRSKKKKKALEISIVGVKTSEYFLFAFFESIIIITQWDMFKEKFVYFLLRYLFITFFFAPPLYLTGWQLYYI